MHLYNIIFFSIVEKVKDIHRKVGGENMTEHNMTQYIVHPINVFHLVKRLIRVWPGVVKTLRDSHTCIMRTFPHLENHNHDKHGEHDKGMSQSQTNLRHYYG